MNYLKNPVMKKDTIIIIGIILLGMLMYGLTLRGNLGNPTAEQFKNNLDQPTNAFELSPERGRYVQVANMAESGKYDLSKTWADIAYPDVGVSSDGKFNSFFAPGVSYFTLPFYLVGAKFRFGQIATFAAESLVSIITLVFIYLTGLRIFGLPRWAAFFAVLTYGFASTSWGYAITLYQNAFTACFIITGFYATWRFAHTDSRYRFLYAAYIWLAYALAFFVDYPNAVLMLPVMVYFAASTFSLKKIEEGIALSVHWSAILTVVVFIFVMGLQFWHNATYYGGWRHLAGELHDYKHASIFAATTTPTTTPIHARMVSATPLIAGTVATGTTVIKNKTAVGFFHEKAVPTGLFILLLGDERGLLFFSPIFLFAFLGVGYALQKKDGKGPAYAVPISLIVVNIFLYSAWGDPWGGWAYGPRYLIPSMPWLALFVAVALSRGPFSAAKKILGYGLFLFSSAVALLGALTSNAIPPKTEAILLPVKSYNFIKDIGFLEDNRSSSFMYKTYLHNDLSLLEYFTIIYLLIALVAAVTLLLSYNHHHE